MRHQKIIMEKNKYIKNDFCYSFNVVWILSQLNLNIDDNSSHLVNFNYGVFLISLVGLVCFINIIGYILAYFLLKKIDYEKNYPRFSKILDRYKKFSYFYFLLEVIICFISLSTLVILTFLFLIKNTT